MNKIAVQGINQIKKVLSVSVSYRILAAINDLLEQGFRVIADRTDHAVLL